MKKIFYLKKKKILYLKFKIKPTEKRQKTISLKKFNTIDCSLEEKL